MVARMLELLAWATGSAGLTGGRPGCWALPAPAGTSVSAFGPRMAEYHTRSEGAAERALGSEAYEKAVAEGGRHDSPARPSGTPWIPPPSQPRRPLKMPPHPPGTRNGSARRRGNEQPADRLHAWAVSARRRPSCSKHPGRALSWIPGPDLGPRRSQKGATPSGPAGLPWKTRRPITSATRSTIPPGRATATAAATPRLDRADRRRPGRGQGAPGRGPDLRAAIRQPRSATLTAAVEEFLVTSGWRRALAPTAPVKPGLAVRRVGRGGSGRTCTSVAAALPGARQSARRMSSTLSLASPNSIAEFSRKNSGFCTPA